MREGGGGEDSYGDTHSDLPLVSIGVRDVIQHAIEI